MKQNMIELYRKIRDLHNYVVSQMETINLDTASCGNVENIADTAFALRECATFAEEIKKKCDKMGWLAQKTACYIYVSMNENGAEPIRTEYCTATPDIKQVASLPDKRKQPAEYASLMAHYAIPLDVYAGENPLMQAYWPGMIERINADQKAGLPLPPGIDPTKLVADYRLLIRKKKGVIE